MANGAQKNCSIFIVPTGIGAKIGGYAGDASFWAQKFAQKIELIVNPNVVNAAVFSGITNNMLYTEGSVINELLKGNIGLKRSQNNNIGVIFDAAIPENVLNVHINTINAVKTVYGINISEWVKTEEPVNVNFRFDESGISTGEVLNPETLKQAGEKLKAKGVDSLAVVCLFPEPDEDEYETGEGVDIVGGVEAMISHYLSKELLIQCVHAPAFEDMSISTKLIHPKACAEYITPTVLPCLFFGLKNAPKICSVNEADVTFENVKYLILPSSALGSEAVFSAIEKNIEILAVEENSTVLSVDAKKLRIEKYVKTFPSYQDVLEYIG